MSGSESSDQAQAAGGRSLRSRPRMWLGAIAALGLVLFVALHTTHKPAGAATRKVQDAVTVNAAAATRNDVPVTVEGLGTVQAFYTATLAAQVNGQLQQVFFKEGQLVKKGQLLAQIDPRPLQAVLDQATAQQAKDASQLEAAKRDLNRYQLLAPQNLTSGQTLDQQRGIVAGLNAQLRIDQAAIDNARTQLGYTRITAPFDGRTGIRLVDPGNNVHATDTSGIVVVTQVQPISVVFTLPEEVLPQISAALEHRETTVTAFSRDDKIKLDVGTLSVVDNQIDQTTGTIRMKATFPNAHNTLWPGQFVNARVLVAQLHNAVVVPNEAVQPGANGTFIYVIKPDSTVEARPVQVGQENDGRTVVLSGLDAGERVVTTNQFRLEPGVRVHVL
jgi:membrane fusion protein, multidrug efflux system